MKQFLMTTLAALLCCQIANAQELSDDEIGRLVDSIAASYQYQTGQITLGDGLATLNVPTGFRYLNPEQSRQVLEDLWGNPPGQVSLGMIFPTDQGPTDSASFAFNITWDDMGYVKDGDADDINYDELLESIKKDSETENQQLVEQGYEPIHIIGWAAAPYYDKEKKVLHWAKEFRVGDYPESTLNYDVRVLGRKGVLSMNAIGMMNQLETVKSAVPGIISSVAFTEGHRYADFSESSGDKIAAWSIGGLVAGKVLAKAGFFAIIAKFGKVIIVALLGGGAALWRFISGRRKQEEDPYAISSDDQPSNGQS